MLDFTGMKQFLGLLALGILVGCAPTVRETGRVTSPDGRHDAVLAIKETDATVATPTVVYVVPQGRQKLPRKPVFLADHVENAELTWDSAKVLRIRAKRARIFREVKSIRGVTVQLDIVERER